MRAGNGGVALPAAAKINLALHVIGRRPDGYHLLDMVAVFVGCRDRLTAAPADDLTLSITGPLAAHAPAGDTNLALRAARLLRQHAGLRSGAALRLDKHVPSGAGFGGGSADAAAALRALNALWDLRLDTKALAALGEPLGADVPMCVHATALRARGVGEKVEPIAGWPPLPLVLVWPGFSVSTAAVFSALQSQANPPLSPLPDGASVKNIAAWVAGQRNDLQPPAFAVAPQIRRSLDRIGATGGCLVARMSGSGSGCFGVYATEAQSRAAAEDLRAVEPGWWVEATLGR